MKTLMVLFVPPLYLFIRQHWVAGVINLVFYLSAFPLLFIAGLGVIPWGLCVAHSGYYLRKEQIGALAEKVAVRTASKVADEVAATAAAQAQGDEARQSYRT